MAGTPAIARSLNDAELAKGSDSSLIWMGSRVANAPPPDLWAGAPAPNDNDPSRAFLFFDDFLQQASATASAYAAYTAMNDAATGTPAFQNVAGGVYNLVTAAAQDDYSGIRTTAKPWLFAAGKELWLEARFKVAEAATNKSAWIFGLVDTVTTGGLQTGASGPLASYDGAVIWKDEGAMIANFETSKAGTQSTTSALGTVVTDTWTKVGFYFDGAATTANIFPYVDVGAGWVAGASKQITLSGLNQMQLIATIKAGAGGAAETLQVDYLKVLQLR